jgi:hypothetical protein
MQRHRLLGLFFLLVVVSGIVGACGGNDQGDAASTGRTRGLDESREQLGQVQYGADRQVAGSTGGGGGVAEEFAAADSAAALPDSQNRPAGQLPAIGPTVIKTADLELEVDKGDFRDAVEAAMATAERNGGFVVDTSVDDVKLGLGSVTLRVPADRFGRALSDLQDLGKVERETVSGQDVTQEFIDLEARLRNLEAQERVLLNLMNEAQTVADTIRVQNELTGIQLEVERLKGRLRYLEDQTALSTIHVRIAEAGAAPPRLGTLQRAWTQSIDVFLGVIAAVIVGAGFVVPVALMGALVLFIVWRLRPRVEEKVAS